MCVLWHEMTHRLLSPVVVPCQEIPHIWAQKTVAARWSGCPWGDLHSCLQQNHGIKLWSQECSIYVVHRLKSAIYYMSLLHFTFLCRLQRIKKTGFIQLKNTEKPPSVLVQRLWNQTCVCMSSVLLLPHESLQFCIFSYQTLSSSHPSSCPPILSHQHWKVEVGAVCKQSAECMRLNFCMSLNTFLTWLYVTMSSLVANLWTLVPSFL